MLLAAGGLSGCRKEAPCPTGLAGRWKLVDRLCFCPRTPVPNERLEFSASTVSVYVGGRLVRSGTYAAAAGNVCGGVGQLPLTRFVYSGPGWSLSTQDAVSTVAGNRLVLGLRRQLRRPRGHLRTAAVAAPNF